MSAKGPPQTSTTRFVLALRGLVALAILVGFLIVFRTQGFVTRAGGGVFALGFLLVGGSVGGRVAAFVGLPRLTGYLAVGVAAGPFGFGLFSQADTKTLTLVNTLALALIALEAGAELTIDMLRRNIKSLTWASIFQVVLIWGGMAVVFFLLAPFMDFLQGSDQKTIWAVALLWGAMAVSKAPADALAILSETGAKGRLADYALGVVVFLDVVVLVLFAVALMVAKAAVLPTASVSMRVLENLGMELVASIAAGTTFGLLIAAYFWIIDKERLLATVAFAYGVSAFCSYFHYDTLLVFVVAGFVVMNLTSQGKHLVETTESVAAGVMVVFFATAGAQLNLSALREFWPIALALAFGRIFWTWLACYFGHRVAGDPAPVRRYGFTAFISQAGVTIGLATIAAETLGNIGEGIATLTIAVIGINELIGPVAFKIGLLRGQKEEAELPPAPEAEAGDNIPAALIDAAAAVPGAVRKGDRVTAPLDLEDEDAPVAYLEIATGADGRRMRLRGPTLKPLPHDLRIDSRTGLLAILHRLSVGGTGDAAIDEGLVVSRPETIKDRLPALKAPLMALMDHDLHVSISAGQLSVSIGLGGAPEATVPADMVRVWRGLAA